MLQRYRLRQLTRAVYDSADPDHSENQDEHTWQAARSQTRRLLDYPAALAAIAVCILLLIVMMVKSVAWGVERDSEPAVMSEGVTSHADRTAHADQVESAESPGAAHDPPRGHRRHAQTDGQPQSEARTVITVHIEGAVSRTGIVTLSQGARAHEALKAAGGTTPDAALNEINLARKLSDGEYLYIPRIGEDFQTMPAPAQASIRAGGTTVSSGGAPGAPLGVGGGGCVDINAADLTGLQTLNGVGPALAQRILDAREGRGPFMSLDDVDAVSGIGPALMRRIEPQLCPLGGR